MTSCQILAKADHGEYQRVLPVLSILKNPILLTASRLEISATNPGMANCKDAVCGQNGRHRTSCTYASESQLTIHLLGPFDAPPAKKCCIPSSVAPSILDHHAALWWSSPHRSHLSCLPSESRSEFCTPTASSNRIPRGRS